MILYFVRHGQTTYNRDGLGLGRANAPLTELGLAQAAAVGRRLETEPIGRILASPLGRAMDTARAIAGSRAIAIEPRDEIIEMDVGETEGIPAREFRQKFPDFIAAWGGDDPSAVKMPGGESLDEVAARLRPFLAELRDQEHDGPVVLVSHNFTIKVALCELLGLPLAQFRGITIDLASLSIVSINGRRVSIAALNDCCHLHGLNLDPGQRSL